MRAQLLQKIQWAAIGAVVSFGIAAAGFLYTVRNYGVAVASYKLSVAKDQRDLGDKLPAVDVQVSPQGGSTASLSISVINRGDINATPLDITVDHSDEVGDLYLSSSRQRVDFLQPSLSLGSMGTLAPKATGKMTAQVSGVTDGKDDSFKPGVEFHFIVRVRLATADDSIRTFQIVRRLLRR